MLTRKNNMYTCRVRRYPPKSHKLRQIDLSLDRKMNMNILVADDHPLFREGLRRIVQRRVQNCQTYEADRFEVVQEIASSTRIDLFILDVNFPGFSPERDIGQLRNSYPESAIVIVTMQDDQGTIDAMLKLNADGFISKAINPETIGDAIQDVIDGEVVILGPEDVKPMPIEGNGSTLEALGARKVEVLKLLIEGKTNKEIGRQLSISPFTVRAHISAMMATYQVKSRSSLAAIGRDLGL